MSSAVLNVIRKESGSIGHNESVVFDRVLYSSGTIGYDPVTGQITLPEPGRFMVHWWVSLQSAKLGGWIRAGFIHIAGRMFLWKLTQQNRGDLWKWIYGSNIRAGYIADY